MCVLVQCLLNNAIKRCGRPFKKLIKLFCRRYASTFVNFTFCSRNLYVEFVTVDHSSSYIRASRALAIYIFLLFFFGLTCCLQNHSFIKITRCTLRATEADRLILTFCDYCNNIFFIFHWQIKLQSFWHTKSEWRTLNENKFTLREQFHLTCHHIC